MGFRKKKKKPTKFHDGKKGCTMSCRRSFKRLPLQGNLLRHRGRANPKRAKESGRIVKKSWDT